MNTTRSWCELERDAIDAYRSGSPWDAFWVSVADDCRRLQAACPGSRQSLYGRLLALVTSGSEIVEPIDCLLEPVEGSFSL